MCCRCLGLVMAEPTAPVPGSLKSSEPRPFRVSDAEMACLNKYGGGPWFDAWQGAVARDAG